MATVPGQVWGPVRERNGRQEAASGGGTRVKYAGSG
jgi:hypothetical protein